MSNKVLHLLTDEHGRIVATSDGIDQALNPGQPPRSRVGARCTDVVAAIGASGTRVCTQSCVMELEGQHDHGAVDAGGHTFRLLCTAMDEHRVIALLPLAPGALVDEKLSPREKEVLQLVSRGMTNTRIARRLGVSASTIRTHMEHILAKLGVRNRAAAASQALSSGLIEP